MLALSRDRVEQQRGVGVMRRREDLLDGALLHDAAVVQHHHPVGQPPHHGQVVGDEQVGHVGAGLQLPQQLQDVVLHRHVEGRQDLVAQDQLGLRGEGLGDGHPLGLAPAELGRVAVDVARVEVDTGQQFGHAVAPLGLRQVEEHVEGAAQVVADLAAGVERRRRVLEHVLDVAQQFRRPAMHGPGDVGAVEAQLAPLGRDQPGYGAGQRGLAAAALAHEGHRLAGVDGERRVPHCGHRLGGVGPQGPHQPRHQPAAGPVGDLDVLDLEQRRHHTPPPDLFEVVGPYGRFPHTERVMTALRPRGRGPASRRRGATARSRPAAVSR